MNDVIQKNQTAMVCDLETGLCGPADADQTGALQPVQLLRPARKISLYYVTDPICSHCWALEPVLRRFKDEYGRHLEVTTVMGGLLPAWNGFADRANGIGRPADVAGHWREVGTESRMPIDGSVWLRDPLASSYPPSRVYLVLRERDQELADTFLRRAREALFAFDRNIADPEVLTQLVDELGLDGTAVVAEANSEHGEQLLASDIALARELGVRGFPTLLFVDEDGRGVKVTGVRAPEAYADALRAVLGDTEPRRRPLAELAELLSREGLLFAKEIEAYFGVAPDELPAHVRDQLPEGSYTTGEVLGESYFKSR